MAKTQVTSNEVKEGGLLSQNITLKSYGASGAAISLTGSYQDIATITIPQADLPGTGNYKVLVFGVGMNNQGGAASIQEIFGALKLDNGTDDFSSFITTTSGGYFTQVVMCGVFTVSANASHTIKLRMFKGGSIAATSHAGSYIQAIILGKA